jgi:hypothetical protein
VLYMKRLLAILLIAFPALTSSAQLTLTWEYATPPNVNPQRVERCIGVACAGFTELLQLPAAALSHIDATVVDGTTYCYRVFAFVGATSSSPTNVACAVPGPIIIPTIAVLPANPTFKGVAGAPNPSPIPMTITTSNGVSWSSKDTCSFFSVSSVSGASGATQNLIPSAGWSALPVGTTACQITYSAAGITPLSVTVTAVKTAAVPASPINLKVVQ